MSHSVACIHYSQPFTGVKLLNFWKTPSISIVNITYLVTVKHMQRCDDLIKLFIELNQTSPTRFLDDLRTQGSLINTMHDSIHSTSQHAQFDHSCSNFSPDFFHSEVCPVTFHSVLPSNAEKTLTGVLRLNDVSTSSKFGPGCSSPKNKCGPNSCILFKFIEFSLAAR